MRGKRFAALDFAASGFFEPLSRRAFGFQFRHRKSSISQTK